MFVINKMFVVIFVAIGGNTPTFNGFLIRKAQSLHYVLDANIKLLNEEGNEELTFTLQHLLEKVNKINEKLKVPQDETSQHVIEEDILWISNRVMEVSGEKL